MAEEVDSAESFAVLIAAVFLETWIVGIKAF
jgi:hypothetical protein